MYMRPRTNSMEIADDIALRNRLAISDGDVSDLRLSVRLNGRHWFKNVLDCNW